jgi:pyrimidine-nucleoside phosphorylase
MAICFQGMTFDETLALTRAMIDSGRTVSWQRRPGDFYADKHSTGGIGDSVSLVLAPLAACCGLHVPMISGRGLGPTGGTLDKLESIPGFRTDLTLAELVRVTGEVGCAITGQTAEIAPADKKLYALRDVTATVSCLPLIVASIMSKKLAENVDGLVLDVKWGSGAFMRTPEASLELARAMVEVGKRFGKTVIALQTDMNQPLGRCIGNALEVRECIEILAGQTQSAGLIEVTLTLAAEMLLMARTVKSVAEAREILQKKLANGDALKKFALMIAAQGGDARVCDDPKRLPAAGQTKAILAPASGYIGSIACDQIGYAVIALGGGRKVAGDSIDAAVGFERPKKIGEAVEAGEPLLVMHYNDETRAADAEKMAQQAFTITGAPGPDRPPLITRKIE